MNLWKFFRAQYLDLSFYEGQRIKKDGSAYEPTALVSFASCLHSQEKLKNKNLCNGQGRSVLEKRLEYHPSSVNNIHLIIGN